MSKSKCIEHQARWVRLCKRIQFTQVKVYFWVIACFSKISGFASRCSDGADRLREHWDENECASNNVTTLEQCAAVQEEHNEWRNSMVRTAGDNQDNESSVSGGSIASAVISTILALILVGIGLAYLYVYGKRNPGGWTERLASRLEMPYKRFGNGSGILDEPVNENNNQVEMGEKRAANNNNTETSITF